MVRLKSELFTQPSIVYVYYEKLQQKQSLESKLASAEIQFQRITPLIVDV